MPRRRMLVVSALVLAAVAASCLLVLTHLRVGVQPDNRASQRVAEATRTRATNPPPQGAVPAAASEVAWTAVSVDAVDPWRIPTHGGSREDAVLVAFGTDIRTCHRVEQWLEFNAQRLAQYPGAVPDAENWKIWQDGTIPVAEDEIPIPNMGDMMAYICGDEVKEVEGLCVGAWVYLLNERIDASTYDSNMNSGGEIMGWFRDAHDHYLASVSPSVEHT